MRTKQTQSHSPVGDNCERTRLAQGSVAAVDVCGCGMMQLHIGALTLRMAPCAVSDLLSTLGRAVTVYAAQEAADNEAGHEVTVLTSERGQA